jgi:hypothetical protein
VEAVEDNDGRMTACNDEIGRRTTTQQPTNERRRGGGGSATARGRRQLGDGAAAAAARRQQRGSCGGGGSAKANVGGSLAAARQRDVGGSLAAAVDGEDGVQWRRWGGTFDGRECGTMSGRDGGMTRVNAATIWHDEGGATKGRREAVLQGMFVK